MDTFPQWEGLTFDDILLVPQKSNVVPSQANTQTRISRNITINIPIASAAMDTVTESRLAIALAEQGGIGIIHKNLDADAQAQEVDRVKRSENGVINDPFTLCPDDCVSVARRAMHEQNISGIPIVVDDNRLVGILTRRDLRFQVDENVPIREVMTKDGLVTASPDTNLESARDILHQRKVEKLLLVNDAGQLVGLITIKDINNLTRYPLACRDARGRLRVGAAVGVRDDERVEKLVNAEVDLIVVDTAHGHSQNVMDAIRRYKNAFGDTVDIIAGNVATEEGARDLIEAGADGIKVGIGPGSICTTRVVAGVGVPQLSAVWAAGKACREADVPLIADGGIRHSGDMVKALAVGAQCVMLGGLLAGTEEAPGETILWQGRTFKSYRGMGSLGAMVAGTSGERYQQSGPADKLVPEGIEGRVPSKGPLAPYVYQLVGGIRSGMGYVGAATIPELAARAKFIRISNAGLAESHPHDIQITREAPNYSV